MAIDKNEEFDYKKEFEALLLQYDKLNDKYNGLSENFRILMNDRNILSKAYNDLVESSQTNIFTQTYHKVIKFISEKRV